MLVVVLISLSSKSSTVLLEQVNRLGLNAQQRIRARFEQHSILIVITLHLLDAISQL